MFRDVVVLFRHALKGLIHRLVIRIDEYLEGIITGGAYSIQ